MNNIKINATYGSIKGIARKKLAGNWGKVFLAMVLYFLLLQLLPSILDVMFPSWGTVSDGTGSQGTDLFMTYYTGNSIPNEYPKSLGALLYLVLVVGALSAGISYFSLTFVRDKDTNLGNIFFGFGHYFKSLGMNILIGIISFLPLVLLVLVFGLIIVLLVGANFSGIDNSSVATLGGGVIVFFILFIVYIIYLVIVSMGLSMCYYLLVDNTKKGVFSCIKDSWNLMEGNKGHYFGFNLSFIGWYVLAAIPLAVFSGAAGSMNLSHLTYVIVSFIMTLPLCLLYVYINISEAVYFQMLIGRIVPKNPIPVSDAYMETSYYNRENNKEGLSPEQPVEKPEARKIKSLEEQNFTEKTTSEKDSEKTDFDDGSVERTNYQKEKEAELREERKYRD